MKPIISFVVIWLLMIVVVFGIELKHVWAENIDPNDDGSQFCYGENVGWLNAEPSGDGGPGTEVTDLELRGYLWAENSGWVSLSCENTTSCATVDYGVINDGSGRLSGYGWGENVGWISFSCENTSSCASVNYGVTIDPDTGIFAGFAWGENFGWVVFRSTGVVPFELTTSWREVGDTCPYDSDEDRDVDGTDLVVYFQGTIADLAGLAANFGSIACF